MTLSSIPLPGGFSCRLRVKNKELIKRKNISHYANFGLKNKQN